MKRRTNYGQPPHYDPYLEREPSPNYPNDYYPPQRGGYRNGNSEAWNSNFLYLLIISGFIVYGMFALNKYYGNGNGKETSQSIWSQEDRAEVLRGNVAPPENTITPVPETYDIQYSSNNVEPPEENPDVGNRSLNPVPNNPDAVQNEPLVVELETPLNPAPPARIFYVQAGAFQSFTNAKKQQDKFVEQGYKVLIVQFDSDELGLHRLILGEFASEDSATARAKKLKSGRVFELVNGRLYEL